MEVEILKQIKQLAVSCGAQIEENLPWSISETLGDPRPVVYIDSNAATAGVCLEIHEDFISHDGDHARILLLGNEDLEKFIKNLEHALMTAKLMNRRLGRIETLETL